MLDGTEHRFEPTAPRVAEMMPIYPGGVARPPGLGGECDPMPPKTSCPVSLSQFMEKAEPLKIVINGQEMLAEVKQFSTGSFGWYMNAKTVVSIDGKAVSVQIGMNMAVVGSKEAER
jgi:hypothetical protein